MATAENGRVALELLRREPFDLMLLDIEMPEMDGFQVLEQLLADVQLRDLPVIVTSSLEGLDNVVRCIELGAEDYLHKPVNPVLLKARIGASLEKKRLRDQQKEMVRRFATTEVAQDLQQSGFALGGRRVRGAVMFSDIRGFTALVEIAAARGDDRAAEHLVHADVRRHQQPWRRRQPDDRRRPDGDLRRAAAAGRPCRRAVRAALEMIEMVELLSAERAAPGKPPIRVGIGIATGDMVAGYTGTQQRATYTCIGDTVNLAARLEAHTRIAKRPILVDAATRAELGDGVPVEPLGSAQFKGKAAPVEVFAVGVA